MPSDLALRDGINVNLESSWKEVLQQEFSKDYFKNLVAFLRQEKRQGKMIYPPGNQIFAALDKIAFKDVRVVILGQDPYHGQGQANGLCFSVAEGIPYPPSLINIFKELEQDINVPYPESGDLGVWADQGVLLLNATLTVQAHIAGSHQQKGWEQFTDAIVSCLSEQKENLVFLLWGSYAKKKGAKIDRTKHQVLESGHPSPLSANRGYWFGNKHFSKANSFLQSKGLEPIDWFL